MTHRTVTWGAGMDTFSNCALAGVGTGAYPSAVVSAVELPLAAHHTFVPVLVELGVAGARLEHRKRFREFL